MSYYILSAYPAFAIAIASFIYKLVEQMRLRIHL
jgi:hypothetical protein